MTTPRRDDQQQERVPARWTIDRDLDAVAAFLDPWILAAEPDHHPATTAIPLLGTPDWATAEDTTRRASVALYVLACLAEREPVVIAARLAAEIAAGRTAHLVAMRQASHAISAALTPTATTARTATRARTTRTTGPTGPTAKGWRHDPRPRSGLREPVSRDRARGGGA